MNLYIIQLFIHHSLTESIVLVCWSFEKNNKLINTSVYKIQVPWFVFLSVNNTFSHAQWHWPWHFDFWMAHIVLCLKMCLSYWQNMMKACTLPSVYCYVSLFLDLMSSAKKWLVYLYLNHKSFTMTTFTISVYIVRMD